MKQLHFISALDQARITAAIAAAEARTTGQIRVFVSRKSYAVPLPVAERHFVALGMANTTERNGILIFIAPASHTFAIYGDEAIHKRCGPAAWKGLRDEMARCLKGGQYTEAVVQAVERAGAMLADYFPAAGEHPNEQPDEVVTD